MTYDTDALRELHRLIDRRVSQQLAEQVLEPVRGTVASVTPSLEVCSVYLDGGATATPHIRFPAHAVPVVGDDVVVLRRRRDGFLLLVAIL